MARFTLVLGTLLIAVFAVNLISALAGGPALGAELIKYDEDTGDIPVDQTDDQVSWTIPAGAIEIPFNSTDLMASGPNGKVTHWVAYSAGTLSPYRDVRFGEQKGSLDATFSLGRTVGGVSVWITVHPEAILRCPWPISSAPSDFPAEAREACSKVDPGAIAIRLTSYDYHISGNQGEGIIWTTAMMDDVRTEYGNYRDFQYMWGLCQLSPADWPNIVSPKDWSGGTGGEGPHYDAAALNNAAMMGPSNCVGKDYFMETDLLKAFVLYSRGYFDFWKKCLEGEIDACPGSTDPYIRGGEARRRSEVATGFKYSIASAKKSCEGWFFLWAGPLGCLVVEEHLRTEIYIRNSVPLDEVSWNDKTLFFAVDTDPSGQTSVTRTLVPLIGFPCVTSETTLNNFIWVCPGPVSGAVARYNVIWWSDLTSFYMSRGGASDVSNPEAGPAHPVAYSGAEMKSVTDYMEGLSLVDKLIFAYYWSWVDIRAMWTTIWHGNCLLQDGLSPVSASSLVTRPRQPILPEDLHTYVWGNCMGRFDDFLSSGDIRDLGMRFPDNTVFSSSYGRFPERTTSSVSDIGGPPTHLMVPYGTFSVCDLLQIRKGVETNTVLCPSSSTEVGLGIWRVPMGMHGVPLGKEHLGYERMQGNLQLLGGEYVPAKYRIEYLDGSVLFTDNQYRVEWVLKNCEECKVTYQDGPSVGLIRIDSCDYLVRTDGLEVVGKVCEPLATLCTLISFPSLDEYSVLPLSYKTIILLPLGSYSEVYSELYLSNWWFLYLACVGIFFAVLIKRGKSSGHGDSLE